MSIRVLKYVAVFSILCSGIASAYEPPDTAPLEAVEAGRVAFLGRVVEITETSHSPNQSTAAVTIVVSEVLYGLDRKPGDRVVLNCHTRWFLDRPGFAFEARISDSLLVVLNSGESESNGILTFQSWYGPSIDLAYRFSDDPQEDTASRANARILTSLYGKWRGTVTSDDLVSAAKRRK